MPPYEMAHQYPSEDLTNHELWRERQEAIRRRGQAAIYLASIAEEFRKARDAGSISPELWKTYSNAQTDEIAATSWLLETNHNIREAGL